MGTLGSTGDRPALHLLFPADLSPASARAGCGIAQLAGVWDVTTTIVHVARPGTPHGRARAALDAFLPGFTAGSTVRRLLLEDADPASAVAELCRTHAFDAVVACGTVRFEPACCARASCRCGPPAGACLRAG